MTAPRASFRIDPSTASITLGVSAVLATIGLWVSGAFPEPSGVLQAVIVITLFLSFGAIASSAIDAVGGREAPTMRRFIAGMVGLLVWLALLAVISWLLVSFGLS